MSTNTLWEMIIGRKYLLTLAWFDGSIVEMSTGNSAKELVDCLSCDPDGCSYSLIETETGCTIGSGDYDFDSITEDIADVEMKI